MQLISKKIYSALLNSQSILIVPHQKPDGDALGSATAMAQFLHRLNKNFTIFCSTAYPTNFRHLSHAKNIVTNFSLWEEKNFDVIVVLDSGDLRYAGIEKFIAKLKYQPIIINIDHHATNEKYGQHNLVATSASSTAEIVYKFFKHNSVEIDEKIALSLLTGIISDTDNFTNSATTAHSLQISSDLIRHGGNLSLIRQLMFKDKTAGSLKLWGIALSRLTKHEEHEIVYTYLTRKDLLKTEVKDSEAEGIANFLNNLNEGKAGLILKEQPDGRINASFRTTRDDFDVSAITKALGGGGHRKAAGFTSEGTVESVLNKIWETISNESSKFKV